MIRWSDGLRLLALGTVVVASVASAQSSTQVAFAPGGQELFVLDLARVPVGGFRSPIELSKGTVAPLPGSMLSVVSRNGRSMLRATERSELLISLANDQRLPQNFTIEVDLVARDGGPEPDLRLEGTSSINQGDASAHLEFKMDATFGTIYVIGGGTNITEVPIPIDIRVTLPETFTRVGVSVEGSTIRFYINGIEILPDPEQPSLRVQARFARGSVLRVTLGGLTDGAAISPVYLARVRVATGAPATVATAIPAANSETIRGVVSNMLTGIVARVSAQGDASVSWSALQGATSYFVVRWKVDDATCCKNFSPPQGMNRLEWADGVLPMAGTYAYRVYATTASGISTGEATVTYRPSTILERIPGATSEPTAGSNPAGAEKASALGAPAPRTIDLAEVTAIGGLRAMAPRTIDVPAVTATGPVRAMTPRAIALAEVEAVGAARSSTRTLASTVAAPAARTLALPELSGTGGVATIAPRTIAVPLITASGVLAVPLPRAITLPGWTGTGPPQVPQED